MNASSPLARVIRSLRRSPGFVAIATVSMGVALGISTSVFAVMDATTHPEPPFRDVGQLWNLGIGMRLSNPPPASVFNDAVAALDGVERIVGWQVDYNLTTMMGASYTQVTVGHVAPGFFDLLGVKPKLGRIFTAADHTQGGVALVSDFVWRRDYANRSRIGDATVQSEGRVYRIVGVLPRGTDRALRPDVYLAEPARSGWWPSLMVRLKPGVPLTSFQPELKALNERFTKAYATSPKDRGISAYILRVQPDPLQVQDYHRAMVGAAMCILLIACANVAALMLARGLARKRDYALRLALGAQPTEIGREVILEVAILAIAGCIAGVIVTMWFVGLIGGAMPVEMQWSGVDQPQWSWRVLTLAMGTVVVSVAVAAGFPAWIAARTDPAGPLKEGSANTTGRTQTRFRWLVVGELAIAMTLLMSTSLMLKSIRKMEAYDFGYPADRLVIAGVSAPFREDSTSLDEAERRRQQALAIVRAVPGVEAATLAIREHCGVDRNIVISDRTAEGGPSLNVAANTFRSGGCTRVAPRFFSTIEMPLVAGRDFEDGDLTGAGAAIIDERAAKRLFPHESAIGHSIKLGDERSAMPWYTVVGVVKNHMLSFDTYPEMGADSGVALYVVAGSPSRWLRRGATPRGSLSMAFYARVHGDVDSVSLRLAQALSPLTPPRGQSAVRAWNEGYNGFLRGEQFLALVFTCLGIASLLLGAAGLYSVITYVAGQRMREFAVRIALGATRRNVSRLVLREAFLMAIGGTAVGAGFGMWAAFLLWNRMWGIYPVDAQALIVAEAVLVATTMLACLVPALRATRADPLEVMRAT